jgi:ABC-2 type transport system ATP-binding protein
VTDTVIHTDQLTKRFEEVTAVERLSLSVERGEMFGIVGPDGAGKTTTIRMLCGILAPSGGSATILGFDLVRQPDRIKSAIGYLSQRFSLYGDLSVDENIEFFAEINGIYDFRRRRDELLEFTRLTPFRDRFAERLSGGMKQKLALACTLIHRPSILFLDEPTTGVDPVSRRDFWKILQELRHDGITVVMTTPYLDEAERCSRVALLNAGRLLDVNAPSELKRQVKGTILEIVSPRVREAAELLRARPGIEVQAFGDRLHVLVPEGSPEAGGVEAVLRAGGIEISSRRIVPPTLENVFISFLSRQKAEAAP